MLDGWIFSFMDVVWTDVIFWHEIPTVQLINPAEMPHIYGMVPPLRYGTSIEKTPIEKTCGKPANPPWGYGFNQGVNIQSRPLPSCTLPKTRTGSETPDNLYLWPTIIPLLLILHHRNWCLPAESSMLFQDNWHSKYQNIPHPTTNIILWIPSCFLAVWMTLTQMTQSLSSIMQSCIAISLSTITCSPLSMNFPFTSSTTTSIQVQAHLIWTHLPISVWDATSNQSCRKSLLISMRPPVPTNILFCPHRATPFRAWMFFSLAALCSTASVTAPLAVCSTHTLSLTGRFTISVILLRKN